MFWLERSTVKRLLSSSIFTTFLGLFKNIFSKTWFFILQAHILRQNFNSLGKLSKTFYNPCIQRMQFFNNASGYQSQCRNKNFSFTKNINFTGRKMNSLLEPIMLLHFSLCIILSQNQVFWSFMICL